MNKVCLLLFFVFFLKSLNCRELTVSRNNVHEKNFTIFYDGNANKIKIINKNTKASSVLQFNDKKASWKPNAEGIYRFEIEENPKLYFGFMEIKYNNQS